MYPAPMGRWRLLDHTADLAIEGRGGDGPEAVEALLAGLAAQITLPGTVEERERLRVTGTGEGREEALVTALGELLYHAERAGWVFRRGRAVEVSDDRVVLEIRGEPHVPGRHGPRAEIKAATYHDLAFAPCPDGGWIARVVFDV